MSNTFYEKKTILVTGGAGSVGTELVRALLLCNLRELVLIDTNEGAVYDLSKIFDQGDSRRLLPTYGIRRGLNPFLRVLISFSTLQH